MVTLLLTSQQNDVCESKACADLLDMILRKGHPAVRPELDLVDPEDQLTEMSLEDEIEQRLPRKAAAAAAAASASQGGCCYSCCLYLTRLLLFCYATVLIEYWKILCCSDRLLEDFIYTQGCCCLAKAVTLV